MSTTTSTLTSLLPKTNCRFDWAGINLTDTEWESSQSYDLSADLSFEKALAVLSEELSFCDKLEVANQASCIVSQNFKQEDFFKEAGYTRFDLIEQIAHLTKKLPKSFVSWCSTKKLNLKDFRAFLNDFKTSSDEKFFNKLAELDPTKNTGLQLIELYFDLCAGDKIKIDEVEKFKNAETLLTSFKKKRFSVSLSRDNIISEELSKIKVSGGVKVSFKRSGDKRQIRLEVDADSPEQLKDKLEKSITRADSFSQAWNTKVPS